MFPNSARAPASPRSAKGCKRRQAVAESNRLYAAMPLSKSPAIVVPVEVRKTTSTQAKDRMTTERRPLTARRSCPRVVFCLGIALARHRGEDRGRRRIPGGSILCGRGSRCGSPAARVRRLSPRSPPFRRGREGPHCLDRHVPCFAVFKANAIPVVSSGASETTTTSCCPSCSVQLYCVSGPPCATNTARRFAREPHGATRRPRHAEGEGHLPRRRIRRDFLRRGHPTAVLVR
jgi:hypothetical protein